MCYLFVSNEKEQFIKQFYLTYSRSLSFLYFTVKSLIFRMGYIVFGHIEIAIAENGEQTPFLLNPEILNKRSNCEKNNIEKLNKK